MTRKWCEATSPGTRHTLPSLPRRDRFGGLIAMRQADQSGDGNGDGGAGAFSGDDLTPGRLVTYQLYFSMIQNAYNNLISLMTSFTRASGAGECWHAHDPFILPHTHSFFLTPIRSSSQDPFILPHTHSFFLRASTRAGRASVTPPRARPNGGSDAPILYAPHDDRPLIFEHVSKHGFHTQNARFQASASSSCSRGCRRSTPTRARSRAGTSGRARSRSR